VRLLKKFRDGLVSALAFRRNHLSINLSTYPCPSIAV
jgi:hypothetical protein